jgi:Na+-translocating ferredoxin:NAD+ oxidoreductase RnfC subunit
MTLADKVKQAGVVGAGGGGFPAHVKLAAKADTVIANGALTKQPASPSMLP